MEDNYNKKFVSREKPAPIDWKNFKVPFCLLQLADATEVTVLRSSLFFYAGEKTTLGNLRRFFAPEGIFLLEKDGYIKMEK